MKECSAEGCNAEAKFYVPTGNDSYRALCHRHYEEYKNTSSLPKFEVIKE